MTTLIQDLRYALRQLRKSPAFTCTAVLILSIGIGGTTAVFSVLNPLLLQPLPYPNASKLMMVWYAGPGGERVQQTFHTFRELAARSRTFESFAVLKPWQPTLNGVTLPERLDAERVSADYFRVLGVGPNVGRNFEATDDVPHGPRVVILSNSFWMRRFGGDHSVVGREIKLDDDSFTVIGVMPASFDDVLAPSAQAWSPLQYEPGNIGSTDTREWGHHLRLVGRLKSGVSRTQADKELASIASTPIAEFPRPRWASLEHGSILSALQEDVTRGVRLTLLIAFGAVLVVLVIAGANVSNLVLARGMQRQGETALRAALGAAPLRLIRQFVTESLLLAILSAASALVVASVAVRLLITLSPPGLPRIDAIHVDGTVLLFALLVSIVTGSLVGIAPAIYASRRDLNAVLQQNSQRTTGKHEFTQRNFVVAEVALALVLLVSAGLLLRSLRALLAVPPGFDSSHVLTMQVQTFGRKYDDNRIRYQFFENALNAAKAVPGVSVAAFTSQLPLSGDSDVYGAHFDGDVPGTAEPVYRYSVTPGYFSALKIPLRQGRLLNESDSAEAPLAIVISQSLAKRRFPGQDPIGKYVQVGGEHTPVFTVVGVVGDVKQVSLALNDSDAVYTTMAQSHWADSSFALVVRSHANAGALTPAIRQAIWGIDKDQAVMPAEQMDDLVKQSQAERHFVAMLFEIFGLLAIILAAIGLYGVQSCAVQVRTREIGLRSALGATRQTIFPLFLRQGLLVTAIGIGFGVVGSLATSRVFAAILFGIKPLDLPTYLGVIGLLLSASVVASYIPARRAAKVDPMVALRYE